MIDIWTQRLIEDFAEARVVIDPMDDTTNPASFL
jgi:hypothetical protein